MRRRMNLNELHAAYVMDPLGVEDEFATHLRKFIARAVQSKCGSNYAFNHDDIEDTIGDVVLSVWEHLEEYDPAKSLFTTYLHRCVMNHITDSYRKYKKRKEMQLDERQLERTGRKLPPRGGDRIDLGRFSASLSERDRAIIALKIHGLHNQEIADKLEVSLDVVKNTWKRAKGKMTLLASVNV
jgi:RNA polymerase sigma factor (sigma-70 family)